MFQQFPLITDLGEAGADNNHADQAVILQVNSLTENAAHHTESQQALLFLHFDLHMNERLQITVLISGKSVQKIFPRLLVHIVFLHDTLHSPVFIKIVHIGLINITQKSMRREKQHIISVPLPHCLVNIRSDPIIFLVSPARVPAGYIAADVESQLLRAEYRPGIHLIVPLICSE